MGVLEGRLVWDSEPLDTTFGISAKVRKTGSTSLSSVCPQLRGALCGTGSREASRLNWPECPRCNSCSPPKLAVVCLCSLRLSFPLCKGCSWSLLGQGSGEQRTVFITHRVVVSPCVLEMKWAGEGGKGGRHGASHLCSQSRTPVLSLPGSPISGL